MGGKKKKKAMGAEQDKDYLFYLPAAGTSEQSNPIPVPDPGQQQFIAQSETSLILRIWRRPKPYERARG